jgi:O-antigen/teichoic acid export membrane protein
MIQPTISSYIDQLRQHLRIPLYANAYTLIINQFASAALGMLYWAVAAHLFSTEVVGQNSAIISMVLLLAAFAEFSLKAAVTRFIPRAGHQVKRLVIYAYFINTVLALIITVAFLKLGSYFGFTDQILDETRILPFLLLFFPVIWTIFYVQDGVLMGLREAKWVLYENSIYNATKILFLVAIFLTGNRYSVVASWFLPVPFLVLLVNGLIFFRFIPRYLAGEHNIGTSITVKQVTSSVGGDHIGTLLAETCVRLLPLLVLNMLGKSESAYFYQAWLIGNTIYLIAYNFASSFAVEASFDQQEINEISRKLLLQKARLIIPLALAVFVFASFGLSIFGAEYALEGTPLLRWLALAALPMILNIWYLSYARIMGKVAGIIRNQGLFCMITLGLSYWLIPTYGITSVGFAWCMAQLVIALVVIVDTRLILFGKMQKVLI